MTRRTPLFRWLLASRMLLAVLATCGAFWSAAGQSSPGKSKAPPQPWQRRPFDAADENDENKFRQNLLKVMMGLAQSSYRRYQADMPLFPEFAPGDPNEPLGPRESVRGSTLLELHEQGAIWLSLLLSSYDPSLQQFQDELTKGLCTDPSLGPKQVRKKVRKYDINKKSGAKTDELIIETENEFTTLIDSLESTVPAKSDSREFYGRIVASYKKYLQGQQPRVLDLSKPGQATTFLLLSPRFGDSTPLEKDAKYKRTAEEAKDKNAVTRDIRYQGVYVVRVTPMDSKGKRYYIAGFWLYLKINDPEMYVPRDPAHAFSSAGNWDLHHMPPAELGDQGLVSPAVEWMEVEVQKGKLVIVKGQSTFVQRRAVPVDLTQTPIERLSPASSEIESAPPGIPFTDRELAAIAAEFTKDSLIHPGLHTPRMFLDQMPPIPARFLFPDTPEGQRAYEAAMAKAIAPFGDTTPSHASAGALPMKGGTTIASAAPPAAPSPAIHQVDPASMHLVFGKLPGPAEDWLKAPYAPPTNMQQERLKLALYWVSRFLQNANRSNVQSSAVQALLRRVPEEIFCVNNQSVHLAHPVMGGVVLAGMKDSFDAGLPELALDLLSATESGVYQFNNGQSSADNDRSEIARLAREYFASQPIDVQHPDPLLVAARAPSPQQWKLLTPPHVWDCPNPYRFLETKSDDENDPPVKLDEDTVARLKQEKALVTELNLDGIFNKDRQGNYRNDQGALSPLGLLFQLALREPSGVALLSRAEENERVVAANALRSGDAASAASHLARANEIAATIQTVNTLRAALPDAYLHLYLTKTSQPRRVNGSASAKPVGAVDASSWRARWMQYKGQWFLIAGISQSDIPITPEVIEHLAAALNEKLPAGASVLPALRLLKDSVQTSSNPQYVTWAAMLEDIDRRTTASATSLPGGEASRP